MYESALQLEGNEVSGMHQAKRRGGKFRNMFTISSHPADFRLALVLVQSRGAQVAPPLEQHRVADQLEPRRKLQSWLLEHLLQLIG